LWGVDFVGVEWERRRRRRSRSRSRSRRRIRRSRRSDEGAKQENGGRK
jgi:hypothetical protein